MSRNIKESKYFSYWWVTNIHHMFFPFPINYVFFSYSQIYDNIDKCYYYSIYQSISLLGIWDGYRGEEEIETFSFDFLNYKTEFLPV